MIVIMLTIIDAAVAVIVSRLADSHLVEDPLRVTRQYVLCSQAAAASQVDGVVTAELLIAVAVDDLVRVGSPGKLGRPYGSRTGRTRLDGNSSAVGVSRHEVSVTELEITCVIPEVGSLDAEGETAAEALNFSNLLARIQGG
jgi:hypothetical protein